MGFCYFEVFLSLHFFFHRCPPYVPPFPGIQQFPMLPFFSPFNRSFVHMFLIPTPGQFFFLVPSLCYGSESFVSLSSFFFLGSSQAGKSFPPFLCCTLYTRGFSRLFLFPLWFPILPRSFFSCSALSFPPFSLTGAT